ncbi:hypothetical protein NDU88_002531 [Pleurodeles waltl]|uniref:Uncharacterized protein n=1 Tax=Pleurodeles waltl TaxID=8319 RepID=A0AAV7PBX2_PLEWA|nr:hypothetical protein NDU88_002531 [Pleurodeles waltl]
MTKSGDATTSTACVVTYRMKAMVNDAYENHSWNEPANGPCSKKETDFKGKPGQAPTSALPKASYDGPIATSAEVDKRSRTLQSTHPSITYN